MSKLSFILFSLLLTVSTIALADNHSACCTRHEHEYQSLINSIAIESVIDPEIKTDTASCIIPFTRVEKLILIKGRADTTEGNFILDTGAPGLVLNITYFRSYPVTSPHENEQTTITGNAGILQQTIVEKFKLGTFNYYRVEADLINLAHIETNRGVRILGLLGVAMFKQCELIIDYEKSEIHLHYINRKERDTYQHVMLSDAKNLSSYPFDLKDNRILVKTNLSGRDLQFVIDYGAETNIIDSRLPDRILDSVVISGRILLNGAGTKKVEALSGALSGFKLAGLEVRELPVIITNLEYTCFGGVNCINGVLGYDFLSRYKLCFNFVKRKLYILK